MLKGDEKGMFPKDHLDKFYGEKGDQKIEMDDDVKYSYYIFLKEFATRVSSNWRNYLNDTKDKVENAKLHQNLSISDEAFAWWFVKVRYDRELAIATEMKEKNLSNKEWIELHKGEARQGEHDSKKYGKVFVNVNERIKEIRQVPQMKEYQRETFFRIAVDDAKYGPKNARIKGNAINEVALEDFNPNITENKPTEENKYDDVEKHAI